MDVFSFLSFGRLSEIRGNRPVGFGGKIEGEHTALAVSIDALFFVKHSAEVGRVVFPDCVAIVFRFSKLCVKVPIDGAVDMYISVLLM